MIATPLSDSQHFPGGWSRRLGSLGRGALWVLLGRVLGIASTILVNILLARVMSPADFGNFVLVTSVMALGQLRGHGRREYRGGQVCRRKFRQERFCPRTSNAVTRVCAVVCGTAVVAALTWAALHGGGLALLGLPSSRLLAGIIVVGLALLALLQIAGESLRGLQEIRLASLFSGGQTGGLVSNLIFLGLLSGAIVAFQLTLTSTLVLNLTAMAMVLPWAFVALVRTARARLPIDPAAPATGAAFTVRELSVVSLPLFLSQLLFFVTSQGDLWIAGVFCPHDQLALYGAARRLTLLVTMPLQIASLTVAATIAEMHAQGRRAELERMLRRTASLAAIPSLGALLLLMVAGGPTLALLFGPFYAEASLPLAILSAGQLCLVGVGCCGCTLDMTGNQNGSLLVNLAAALALAFVGPPATAWFGLVGLSIACASVVAAQSIALLWLARVRVGVWTHAVTSFRRLPDAVGLAPVCQGQLPQLNLKGEEALMMNGPP